MSAPLAARRAGGSLAAHPARTAHRPRGPLSPARPYGPLAAHGSRGPLTTALAAVGAWLIEPAQPEPDPVVGTPAPPRPVIAVFGLARGCGTTVVARALAAELARRDTEGAAAVHCEARAAGIPLATQAAGRLARQLADVPGADTRAVGRLCLVGGAEHAALADTARHVAPLVLDAGATSLGGVPAAIADEVVVVAAPTLEPALAAVAADCLARLGHQPIVVLNRAAPDGSQEGHPVGAPGAREDPWAAQPVHRLPDSRMGAQLALGGREPRGTLGEALAELAERCNGRR